MSKIAYNLSIIKGIVFDVDGVLSPSTIPLGTDGVPVRMVNIKDGYALQLAAKLNYKIAIITGAVSDAVYKRFSALGIQDIYMGASNKIELLKEWQAKYSLQSQEIAYIGDDIPDIPPMRYAGLSVAPNDACTDVLNISRYISPVNGGYGVARDLLEEILRANGQWLSDTKAFGW
ncbi:HAD hydrolase family protein [uncultured Muribaculum sp.]|uniref:KdsC family phosphatase n=1 Tax=uncultured Muribaculum sp. TaxID=1918613 RepID=UPI0025B18D06|nr:HAD hydrolase family protein [uncultured Muribaculum sp.]